MLPLFAAAMPIVILFCGLVLDCGLLQLGKAQMQSAADAAALGAELEAERGTGLWINAARLDAALNGFTNGVNNTTVTVQARSTAGPYATSSDAIQVTVTQQERAIFMGALNGGVVTVSAQAVALIPPCLYSLGTTLYSQTHDPLLAQSSQLNASCPIYTGGNISVDSLSVLGATAVNLTGSLGASLLGGLIPTTPRPAAAGMADPLGSIVSPSYGGGCDFTNYTRTAVPANLVAGTYCGGITLVSASAFLNPGLYVITGGAHWSGSTVSGSGVTLFFTHGGIYGYGQFVLSGGTTVSLSAPIDASANGVPTVLVFGDRSWVATAPYDFQCTGSVINGDGIWYTTGTGITATACTMSAPHYFGVVTDALEGKLFTSLSASSNYSNVPGGGPFHGLGGMVQ